MKNKTLQMALSSMILLATLTACGKDATPIPIPTAAVPTITATPDLCAPANIQTEVNKVHKYMREFDDESTLAANMPKEQISEAVSSLQKIRREAEDEPIPECLVSLKTYQIAHMNSVINTLLAFMGGKDQQTIDQYLALARQQHDQYTSELARVLGLTVVPLPTSTETPTSPDSTPTP
jgi:hypothetical protein